MLHVWWQPNAVLRWRQVVVAGHLDLHDAAEGVDKLAPGVLVLGVQTSGRHIRAAKHDGRRQLPGRQGDFELGLQDGHGLAALPYGLSVIHYINESSQLHNRTTAITPGKFSHGHAQGTRFHSHRLDDGDLPPVGLATGGAQGHGARHCAHFADWPALGRGRTAGVDDHGTARRAHAHHRRHVRPWPGGGWVICPGIFTRG